MKRIVTRIWKLTLGMIAMAGVVQGQSPPLYKFNFPLEATRWLWYFDYANEFDTCLVTYTFGEVVLETDSERVPVYLSVSLRRTQRVLSNNTAVVSIDYGIDRCIAGSNARGIDTLLQAYSTTHSFTVLPGSKLRFFRNLMGVIKCGMNDDPGRGGTFPSPQAINTVDALWDLIPGCVQDTTEFVVQLVRASDGTVLMVLDSIGIMPNPAASKPQRYGTEIDRRVRTVALPESVWGERVFLRVSPRRYGSTPYGMVLQKEMKWIAESLFFPDSDTLAVCPALLDSAYVASLWEERNRAIFAYVDSVGRTTGCAVQGLLFVGDTTTQRLLSDSLEALLRKRGYVRAGGLSEFWDTAAQRCYRLIQQKREWFYSTFDIVEDGNELLSQPRTTLAMEGHLHRLRSVQNVYSAVLEHLSPPQSHIISPIALSVSSICYDEVVKIKTTQALNGVTIIVYDSRGRMVKRIEKQLPVGESQVSLSLPTGVYFLEVRSHELPHSVRQRLLVVR